MTLTAEEVKKIAHLARLHLSEDEVAFYTPQLTHILKFVEQMNHEAPPHIEALPHRLDFPQRLRDDVVTESNQRDPFQAIAPEVEAGLYLVPKVIEGE